MNNKESNRKINNIYIDFLGDYNIMEVTIDDSLTPKEIANCLYELANHLFLLTSHHNLTLESVEYNDGKIFNTWRETI